MAEMDIRTKMVKRITKDLEYIRNYQPIAMKAKSAEYFSKMTIIKPIALNVYPQIYTDLVQRFEPKEAIHHLRSMGLRVAKFFYSVFPHMLTKSQKFTEILSEVAKSHLKSELIFKDKVKVDKKLQRCTIEVKDCFFCSEIALFEDLQIPYCVPICAQYEHLYNIKSFYKENMEPRLIRLEAVKSAEYDGDTCEYKLRVID